MNNYSNYKSTGIEWIGAIPSHWNKLKIGRTFKKIGSGTTPKSGSDIYYENGNINWLNTGDLNDSYITQTNKKITEAALNEFSTLKLYPKNSIVIALYGATIGKLGQLKIETTTNQACCVLSDSDVIENRYLFYFLLSAREYIISKAYGGGQPNISQDLIKQLYISAPPKIEQKKIVEFLDHQTAIIDQLILQKEKLIELLKEKRQAVINEAVTKGLDPNAKMKVSGIEWLGEIPVNWYTSRFSRGIELLTDYEANGSFDTIKKNVEFTDEIGYAWYVRATDLENNNILDSDKVRWVNEETYNFLSKTKLVGKELLIAKRGEIGKVYLMPETSYKATLAPNLYLVRLNKKLNPNFMWFYFESSVGKKQLMLKNRSVTIGAIYKDDLKEIDIVYPPLTEQLEIVEHLNKRCQDIANIISKVSFQVEKLKEYRQSIISEAVTGRIDVSDWQPNKKEVA